MSDGTFDPQLVERGLLEMIVWETKVLPSSLTFYNYPNTDAYMVNLTMKRPKTVPAREFEATLEKFLPHGYTLNLTWEK